MNSLFELNLDSLNQEQKEAVTHNEGPLLIVAGAGTGKTTVITQRVGWLIKERGLKSDEILALTFTDKAATEMEERVDKLLPLGYTDLWISTFHAFCERILKDYGLEIGLSTDFKLLNQTQSWLLVRQNLNKFNLDYYRPLGNPTKFIHALVKHFSRCKDELVEPADYLKYAEKLKLNSDSAEFIKSNDPDVITQEIKRIEELANAYHVYQQLLLAHNALDFGDLINYCLKLFKERPVILAKFRDQFKYILIDEFQDTNYAQYELIKLIAEPKNNLTVVADDDQSIFKFRGASISNILDFKKDYPKATEIFLIKNYRSKQNILDLAYRFIQLNNPYRLEIKLNSAGSEKKLSKKLISETKGEGTIENIRADSLENEVAEVIKRIFEYSEKNKEVNWNDFAILVRANDSAQPFIRALEEVQLPYQFVASRGLYSKSIIVDIISYLKMLDNYHESPAFYRVLVSPFVDLKEQDLIYLSHLAYRKAWSLYETLQNNSFYRNDLAPETLAKITKFLNFLEKETIHVKDHSVSQLVYHLLEQTGYLKQLGKVPEAKRQEIFRYLNQFYGKVKEFEKDYQKISSEQKVTPLKDYLEQLNLELDSGEEGALAPNLEEGPEAVKIMTVHSAKGLEFKYVFVVNLVDKRFPSVERREPIELPDDLVKEIVPEGDIHLQEERRLFYVALTRAKEGLFLTSAEDYGGLRKKKPSKFLDELFSKVNSSVKTRARIKKDSQFQYNLAPASQTLKKEDKVDYQKLLPLKFSFTQLKAFASCPLQYKYAHLVKIPIKGKAQFSYGKTLHTTLQKVFQLNLERNNFNQADLFGNKSPKPTNSNQLLVSLEELYKIYQENWLDDWYEEKFRKDEYYQNGKNALKNFYDKIKIDLPLVKFLEKSFSLKLGDFTLKGVIDRVDEKGDKRIEIIDYKTGQAKLGEKLETEDKEQLLIYQIAANEVFGYQAEKLTYYYLDSGRAVSFLGDVKELSKIKEKIKKEVGQIRKTDFSNDGSIATPGFVCKFCDFKEICEYAQR